MVATLLAAGSHTAAGLLSSSSMTGSAEGTAAAHATPSVPVLVLTLVFSALICTGLAGRMLSWWRLLGAVSASQFLYHGAYSLSPGHSGAGSAAGPMLIDPHAHHLPGGAFPAVGGAELPGATMSGLSATADHTLGPAMLMAHLTAAILTVAVLRGGERATLSALGWFLLRTPAGQLVLWRPAVPYPVVPIVSTVGLRWRATPILTSLRLRGPPATSF
ncbi:hypothetical protein [Citricoccus sp.]|uniref:hypothetical protein n=1 Tax=Citricoccus sp. TaxID=1978372 RepID=UPI0028BE5C30|nr:hypothetical protein [Citricoccus sp.]